MADSEFTELILLEICILNFLANARAEDIRDSDGLLNGGLSGGIHRGFI